MRLKIYNDGKEKSQSYEATIEDIYEVIQVNGSFITSYDISSLTGYGADAEEAKEDLMIKLNLIIKNLSEFRDSLIN